MIPTEELEALAKHVDNEIDEFRKSCRDLPGLKLEKGPHWNRKLESFLWLFRVLRGFFFGEGIKPKGDLHAIHYIPTWGATKTKDDIFTTTKDAIDQKLAHLTLERMTDTTDWPVHSMGTAMEALISDSKKSLLATQAGWFRELDEFIIMFGTLGAEDNSTFSGPRPSPIRIDDSV